MKKLFAIFFSILYLISSNSCFAMVSKLYFVKNSSKDLVKPIIENELAKQKYTFNQKDPYYAVLNKDNYVVIILQKSSENYFYYYLSNSNSKANKNILNGLKNNNVTFEESFNNFYIGNFESQAQKILSNTMTTYNFDDNTYTSQNSQRQQTTAQNKDNTVLRGYVGQVAKGTTFNAYLQTPINTAKAQVGDTVTAVLTENWVYNGSTVASQGSLVSGKLTKARHATYGSVNGRVVISFDNIRTPEGKSFDISAEKIDFTVSNEGKLTRTAQSVAKSAITGALLGLLVGALSDDYSMGSSAAIGAGVGAGGALITSGAEQGVDAEIPTYTEMEITLEKPLNVILKY